MPDQIAELPESFAAEVAAALESIPAAFGRPHVHSGLGLRQLRRGLYEARVGLDMRALFTREGDWLRVQFLGNHDEVKKMAQALKATCESGSISFKDCCALFLTDSKTRFVISKLSRACSIVWP